MKTINHEQPINNTDNIRDKANDKNDKKIIIIMSKKIKQTSLKTMTMAIKK